MKKLLLALLLSTQIFAATSVSFNGSSYSIPGVGEDDWAGADKVDGFLIAVGNNALAKSGGSFTITAEVDWGSTAGHKLSYIKSQGTNVASSGILRMANAECVGWRNAGNSANLSLCADSSDRLTYGGAVLASSSGVVPISAGGTGLSSYTSGDVLYATSSSTVLSKLAIGSANTVLASDGSTPSWRTIVNADVSASAAIARSKVAAGTADHVVINDGSGNLSSDAALNVAQGGTNIASYTSGDVLYASGGTTLSKLGIGTAGQLLRTNSGATAPEWGIAGVAVGGTNLTAYTAGDILYSSSTTVLSKLAIGTAGQVLKVNSGATAPEWGSAASSLAHASKTANYTLTSSDDVINCDSSGGAFTLTLPAAASNTGKTYHIKVVTGSGIVTVDGNASETIDDMLTVKMATAGDSLTISSNGTNWKILNYGIFNGARAATDDAQSIANNSATTITFEDETYDPLGQYETTGIFTVQVPGTYRVSSMSTMNGDAGWNAGERANLQLFKNTGGGATLNQHLATTLSPGGNFAVRMSGSADVKCNAGDTLELKMLHTSGVDPLSMTNDGNENWISFTRVGN